jgi:hypothetical protein
MEATMADSSNNIALPISQLTIAEQACIHETCLAISNLTFDCSHQDIFTERVEDFLSATFESVASEIVTQIRESFESSKTTDKREIELIAKIMIPYHMENENLQRAGAAISNLIYRQSSMAKAA